MIGRKTWVKLGSIKCRKPHKTVVQDSLRRYFRLVSSEGQTRMLATSADSDVVDALYSEAKRKAFNVDKAIADIILSGS